jgi:hypothetical protein
MRPENPLIDMIFDVLTQKPQCAADLDKKQRPTLWQEITFIAPLVATVTALIGVGVFIGYFIFAH